MRGRGDCGLPEPALRRNVWQHVTVENPVTRAVGDPCQPERAALTKHFGDRHARLIVAVNCVTFRIAYTVHAKVEAVQVHWMGCRTGIDHAPMHALAYAISEPFSVWPRESIDPQRFAEFWRLRGIVIHNKPAAYHHCAIYVGFPEISSGICDFRIHEF